MWGVGPCDQKDHGPHMIKGDLCSTAFFRDTEPVRCIHKEIHDGNCSIPEGPSSAVCTVCKPEDQESQGFNESESGGLRTKPMSEGRRKWMSQLMKRERKRIPPSSLCSAGALSRLDDAAHTGEGGSSLLDLPVQILTPSRNTFTHTPKCDVFPAVWAALSSDKLTDQN